MEICYQIRIDVCKKAKVGNKAPNSVIFDQYGVEHSLLDFCIKTRPLVVNFGSFSWPDFSQNLQEFHKLSEVYACSADFLIVYIEEAHPVGGWELNVSFF